MQQTASLHADNTAASPHADNTTASPHEDTLNTSHHSTRRRHVRFASRHVRFTSRHVRFASRHVSFASRHARSSNELLEAIANRYHNTCGIPPTTQLASKSSANKPNIDMPQNATWHGTATVSTHAASPSWPRSHATPQNTSLGTHRLHTTYHVLSTVRIASNANDQQRQADAKAQCIVISNCSDPGRHHRHTRPTHPIPHTAPRHHMQLSTLAVHPDSGYTLRNNCRHKRSSTQLMDITSTCTASKPVRTFAAMHNQLHN